jgi:DNA repair protein RecO (recombination protein O)
MDEKTLGLILRTRPLTETSLIVHWLTPESGRIATVAKGARRPKSPFRGKLDLFHLAEFSYARSRRSDLHALREVSLRETHRALRKDVHLLQQAAYCALLVEQATESDTPLPGIFRLMTDWLAFVSSAAGGNPLPVLAFEVKFLAETGLLPDPGQSKLSPGARQGIQKLASADWDLLAKLKFSRNQIAELSRFLHGFLIWHLGRVPEGRPAALA